LSFLIIEALASGLPAIVTDMGGNRDIVNDQTGCGILVKYNDPENMAQAICRVMDDKVLLETMKYNAAKAIDEKFNLVKMIEHTYNLYVEFTGKQDV
jgi:L-malate glycosyltransferase